MSANKGTGVNKVLIRLLKICVNEIVESLTYIMNRVLKLFFKPGDKLELNRIIRKFQLN